MRGREPNQTARACVRVCSATGPGKQRSVAGDALRVCFSRAHLQALGDDDAGGGEHGPPRVQQLVGAVLLHLGLVLAQAERVVPVAAPATSARCQCPAMTEAPARTELPSEGVTRTRHGGGLEQQHGYRSRYHGKGDVSAGP